MRVHVEEIPEDGLPITASEGDEWAVGAATLAFGAPPESLDFKVRVTRIADYVRVSGRGDAVAVLPCARCGEPLRLRLSGPVDLYFAPEDAGSLPGTTLLSSDDLDIGWYDGSVIDLADVLSEQIALWEPDRVRCSDRGIEPVGGPRPCTPLPDRVPEQKAPSPFAKLRLPE